MNKVLLTSLSAVAFAAVSITAQAINWVPVASPRLNMENNPAGLSSVELTNSTPLRINRACMECAVLEKNGEIVKQIPASNKIAVYTFDGFTKTDEGSLHITFWDNLSTTPYKYTGTYKVTIPAGYFYYSDGTLNEPLSCQWGINNPELIVEPATGSVVTELKTVKVTFPDAQKIQFISKGYSPENPPTKDNETRSVFYSYDPVDAVASEDGTEPYESGELIPVIDGNVATFTIPEVYTSGTLTMTFGEGAFNVLYPGSSTVSTSTLTSARYTIMSNSNNGEENAGYTITPEPGEVYQIPSAPIIDHVNGVETVTEAYFILYPPKDKTVTMVKGAARLYAVYDGVRDSSPLKTFNAKKYNDENAIMFTIAGSESEAGSIKLAPGEYELVVAKNTDMINRNPELVYTYTFLPGEVEINTAITPANDDELTEPLEKITIEFTESDNVTLAPGAYATIMFGTIEYSANVALETINEHPAVVITPYAQFVNEGKYVVSISGSSLVVDGTNYPINIVYNIGAGVTSVEAVTADYNGTVYGIDGTIVVRNAGADAINALTPGLYIINGKKIIVK